MGCFSAASSSTKASLTTLASRSIVRRCRGTSAAQAADVHVISRGCQTVAELQHSVPCLHFGHVQLHDDLWLSAHLARKALIEYCYCTQGASRCLWQLWHQGPCPGGAVLALRHEAPALRIRKGRSELHCFYQPRTACFLAVNAAGCPVQGWRRQRQHQELFSLSPFWFTRTDLFRRVSS